MKNKVNGKGSSPANIKNERIESKWYLPDNMIDPIKELEKNVFVNDDDFVLRPMKFEWIVWMIKCCY